jgi:hypothetical protein
MRRGYRLWWYVKISVQANAESIYEGMAFLCFSFICFLLLNKDISFDCCSEAMLL